MSVSADAGAPAGKSATDPLAHFEKRIRPVLVEHCYACHSAEAARAGKLKGGLQLDTRDGIRQGGDSGPSVIPGKTNEGWLLSALRHEEFAMPPDRKLSAATIADFEAWIANGAVDPRDGTAVVRPSGVDLEKAREFWSFQPLRQPAIPDVDDAAWPISDIDCFIRSGFDACGLQPVGDADAQTLFRRLSFDLIGLPPAPEEIRAFVAAAQADRQLAITEAVERLLASPHFGERWGRHWLDVARYADSNGRDMNVVWFHAWQYRNWVIRAFNADKPFDDFIREQIAGDLLPAESAIQRDEHVIATAFLALSPKMIVEVDPAAIRMDIVDQQIDLVSRAFVGLSIGCARCHDHKFDPIPTRDYYALAGIFQSTEPLYGLARLGTKNSPHTDLFPIGPDAGSLGPVATAHYRRVVEQSEAYSKARSDRYRIVTRIAALKVQLEQPEADKSAIDSEIAGKEVELKEWDQRVEDYKVEQEKLFREPPPQPAWTMAARERPSPSDCRLHIRGEATNLGDEIPRGVPQIVSVEGAAHVSPGESGRRQLAEWLASAQNPLAPRVAVNRVWSHLFGRGLVASVDDFGATGSPPSHPELLDHLASRFVADGWSTKRLIRSLVLSRTYQLSSAIEPEQQHADPDNVLLWRFRPRPIEVEAFRDAVLSVSGALDRSPPACEFLSPWNQFEHETLKSFAPFILPAQIEFNHRSIYLPVLRDSLPDLFRLFDFADPGRIVGKRDESVLPAQALFLMNSQWLLERSRLAAERLLARRELSDAERIDLLYEEALSRLPDDSERTCALEYLREPESLRPAADSQAGATPPSAIDRWISFCQLMFANAEFRFLQ